MGYRSPVRLRLAAIRSIRVTRFDGSSSAATAITSSNWWSVERTAWSHRVVRFEIGHLKPCTLARQPLLGAREILVLALVVIDRRMVLEHPPRPGPRAGRAAVEQPWLGVGQLGGPAAADPEPKQRLAMRHPIGAHQVTDKSAQVLPDAIAITVVSQDRVVELAGQQLARSVGGREFDSEPLPPRALRRHVTSGRTPSGDRDR